MNTNTEQATEQLRAVIDSFIQVHDGDDHLAQAKKFTAAAFTHRPIIDMRLPPEEKKPWLSGGTRNPHGSTKKFNASRGRLTWASKWQELEEVTDRYGQTVLDEAGNPQTHEVWKHHTKFLGRNAIKAKAKELGKLNGISYGASRRLLDKLIQARVDSNKQEE